MSYTASYIVNSSSAQGTTDFQFTFPYIKEEHIEVFLNYNKITQGSGSAQYQVITNVSPKLIRLNTGIASANLRVEVRRNSSLGSPLVDYADGSTLTANDLDTSALQSLYIDQELKDNQGKTVSVDEATGLPSMGESSAGNLRLTKVADPTAAQDAATKNYVDTKQFASAQIVDGTIVNADVNASAGIEGSKLQASTGSNAGSMSAADKSKLDGIETAATADQTNAEIRAAVEAASDSNVFTDADHTKLNAIEASATADQTDAEIRTAVENATDSNVFTDADHTKLNGIETSATADQTDAEIRAAVEAASDSNVFTDADHTKLNGIEASATADQTAAEIKTAYESNAQTNPLTDAEKAVIDGVTANTSEINKLDGVTASTTELNIVAGKSFKTSSGTLDTTSDTEIPSSKVIAAHVASSQTAIGGFVTIADEVSFPNTQPATGVVISINNAAGVVINGSGVSTTGRRLDSTTVTINGFPSSLNGETLAAGVGLVVTSTSTANTYAYHKLLAAETDVKQLSDDINDFNARYRVASSAPGSSNDAGDMYFDTSANKMKVYNGTTNAWDDVASVGSFYVNTISSSSGTGGGSATFNGSAYRFTLSNAGTSAQQHIVSVNGVIQKPSSGTSQPSEGFALSGNDIIFSAAPASGSDSFIITCGSSVSIGTPSANSVNSSHIIDGSIVDGDISNSANIAGSKIADDSIPEAKLDIHNAPTGTDKFLKYSANGMEWVVPSYTTNTTVGGATGVDFNDNIKARFGTGNDLEIYHDGSHSNVQNSTGNLHLRSNANCYIQLGDGSGGWENALRSYPSGAVELYHNDVKKIETTSSGINVTGQINVNGSPLSAAPEITATATGAIANQGAVCVRSDGNIEAISGNAAATGSATVIDSGATSPSRIKNPFRVLYNPDKSRMYVLYSSSPDDGTGDNNLKIVSVTLNSSDNTMSMGTPYLIRQDIHGTMTDKVADMAYDTNADKLVVVYRHSTNYLAAVTLTPDSAGTSFSMGTPNVFTGGASEDPEHVSIAFDSAQNKFLCIYVRSNNELKYNVMYISGTSIATSNGQTKDAGSNYEPYVVYDPDQAKFIVSVTGGGDGKTIGASIDAGATTTSVTWDTNYSQYKAGGTTRENRLVYDTTNNKVVVLYQQGGNLLAKVGTNSGTGVTWGSEVSYNGASSADEINAVHDSKMDNIFVITTSNNNEVLLLKGDISGTTISFSTVTTLQSANSFTTAIGFDSDTGKVLGVYRDSATNDNLEGRVHQPAGTNVTAGNFIGFASAAISNGASGTVKVVGNTATKSSLTPGQKYFVQNDGSLGLTAANPSVEAGIALSSTKLLIKG